MKKFNIFEYYGQVHGEKIEAPKVQPRLYSPISSKRKDVRIVDGKFSITESLKPTEDTFDKDRPLANGVKKHFLEIISTYNSFREQLSRSSDIVEISETLGGVIEAAKELTLREGNDWFDKMTIKRNMNELHKLDSQFTKFSQEAKKMDERLSALYEDMGHILSRYYEISDLDGDVVKERLGLRESKNDYMAKHGRFDILLKRGYKHADEKKLEKLYDELGKLLAKHKLPIKTATLQFE